MSNRDYLKDKKRIIVKVGSSTLTHPETGHLNLAKLDKLVQVLSDLKNMGKDVILVSSGAIPIGAKAAGLKEKPTDIAIKQACASVGQATLMMIYQKFFREFGHTAGQILLTKDIMDDEIRKKNAENTFKELCNLDIIPIVNENDTISTEEIEFGDNDTLSAIVAKLVQGDLLILLSDIDGLYTDDPRKDKNAQFIPEVDTIDENLLNMAKGAGSKVGTGGMVTKILAAKIATEAGIDMIISNGNEVKNILKIIEGREKGTLFKGIKIQ
ncbi:glutamate 5-kinase [Natranaerovirga hydrolytica]|uniref:Glutamate 5-kinase n=1 Tax=Natranaerovirga hydrolytica TaxID=680378 RepID=A0A4R1MY84_9FIRM|nr:glutamate 5-kinase [Natranaerovirga hydrolytica]TCK98237.1 glutamate 5-kinase [Natranaerovirga hydrolytica]